MTPNLSPLNVLTPLQFELMTGKADIYANLLSLRSLAMEKFSKVSKIFRLLDDACRITGNDDILIEQKVIGTCVLVQDNKIATVKPTSIIGFTALLPNGNHFHVAFATYPPAVNFKDSVILGVPLDEDKAAWCGLAETSSSSCDHKDGTCEECVQSHLLVCELLDCAEKLGVVVSVSDPTGFWETRNLDNLTNNFRLIKSCKARVSA